MPFAELGLEPRVLQAVKKKGYRSPTPVQAASIPAIISGQDVLAQARTGTGKTMAYLLPVVNQLLGNQGPREWEALVLVPTRELCEQVRREAEQIINLCRADLKVTALAPDMFNNTRRTTAEVGAIVVATPGLVATTIISGTIITEERLAERLSILVVDEADLIMSYGYTEDLEKLSPKIPRSCQCILMSATGGDQINHLNQLLLHNPVQLNLLKPQSQGADGKESSESGGVEDIDHSCVTCNSEDKLLHLFVCLKYQLVQNRVLVFVNEIDSAYRARLFLEKFGIKSVVLHRELPLGSRHSILQQFNVGLHHIMIVADDTHALSKQDAGCTKGSIKAKKRKRHIAEDHEFGVTRGLDFKNVCTVINLELPGTADGYVHRAGRSGRAGSHGTVLTFFTPCDGKHKDMIEMTLKERQWDAGTGDRILKDFALLKPCYVESLRYRGQDVQRSCTRKEVREAWLQDLRKELLNSKALKEHFNNNPKDKDLLEHDRPLVRSRKEPQLLMPLPSYIQAPGTEKLRKRKKSFRGRQMSSGMKFDPLKVDVYKWKPIARPGEKSSLRKAKSRHRSSGVPRMRRRHGKKVMKN